MNWCWLKMKIWECLYYAFERYYWKNANICFLTDDKYTTYTKVGNQTYNYINYTMTGELEDFKLDSDKDN